jgi:lactoylglutathione lyase
MIKQIAHLCINTDQFEAMIEFYRDILGLPVAFTLDSPVDGTPFGYYFSCGETTFIELFDRELSSKVWGGNGEIIRGSNISHFCFQATAMAEYRDTLISKGIAVTEIATGMDRSRQCWIKDPDGNAIELMEYTNDSLQTRK